MYLPLVRMARSTARALKWQKGHMPAIQYRATVIAPWTRRWQVRASPALKSHPTPHPGAGVSSRFHHPLRDRRRGLHVPNNELDISLKETYHRKIRGIGMCNTKQTRREA